MMKCFAKVMFDVKLGRSMAVQKSLKFESKPLKIGYMAAVVTCVK